MSNSFLIYEYVVVILPSAPTHAFITRGRFRAQPHSLFSTLCWEHFCIQRIQKGASHPVCSVSAPMLQMLYVALFVNYIHLELMSYVNMELAILYVPVPPWPFFSIRISVIVKSVWNEINFSENRIKYKQTVEV